MQILHNIVITEYVGSVDDLVDRSWDMSAVSKVVHVGHINTPKLDLALSEGTQLTGEALPALHAWTIWSDVRIYLSREHRRVSRVGLEYPACLSARTIHSGDRFCNRRGVDKQVRFFVVVGSYRRSYLCREGGSICLT